MTFTATESTTAPIILGKEPVEKPKLIARGWVTLASECVISMNDEAQTVNFRTSEPGFAVTYHDVPMHGSTGRFLHVDVRRDSVVTWERLPEGIAR